MSSISKFFKPKNAGKTFVNELSPNGEYRLFVTAYATAKGCWSYSQGLVYHEEEYCGGTPLFEVQRNYSSFPFSWIEHPNGHQYLICGADYQGQTVLELDTGKRIDFLPPEAKEGCGFCWVSHKFDTSTRILTVCGCVWACPYEFRFYDFSDPMKGWPEIALKDDCIYDDLKWPTFESDGTIKTYCTETNDDDDDDEEDSTSKPEVIRSVKTLVREGLTFKILSEEVSEKEKIKKAKQEESHRLYEEKMKIFKETDPLYLRHLELIKDKAFSPESHYGIGVTHKDWCPHFKVEEKRFCRRIMASKKIVIDLEWGMYTGPIKLVVYKNGKFVGDKWFEHSVEGLEQAFKVALGRK